MRIEEIKKVLDNHEERLMKIERQLSDKTENVKERKAKDYKGLAGGIRFLMDNGFFKQPRSLSEIIKELKREGYHYSKSGVASTLSETFTKKQKILNRIKEGKIWGYVIRK